MHTTRVSDGHARLVLGASILTCLLIAMGGIVCATESGEACPDWPGCYGRAVPPLQINAIIEYTHRLIAALTTPFILAAAFVTWRRARGIRWLMRPLLLVIPFLIAVPIFTAILIGDGGYGAVMLLALTVGYRRAVGMLGKHFTQLLLIVAGATLAWGLTCATFFGVTLYPPLIAVDLSEQSREFMMRLCFVMGAIHLSIAQLWGAAGLFPDLRFLSKVGWSIFIWGMLGVVQMFVLKTALNWSTPWPYLLLVGAALAIVFHQPSRNPVKMLGWGLANFPLSMLSAFSDVISYVRLMAVGLASGVLATNFNEMASGIEPWPLAALVLVFGHSLNMGLAMIAMFAHGVRLNMLEFCNHLGMQWTGYAYSPFSK